MLITQQEAVTLLYQGTIKMEYYKLLASDKPG